MKNVFLLTLGFVLAIIGIYGILSDVTGVIRLAYGILLVVGAILIMAGLSFLDRKRKPSAR